MSAISVTAATVVDMAVAAGSDIETEIGEWIDALSLSVDESRVHEKRLEKILRRRFCPVADDGKPPLHLRYISQVLAPNLQRSLNAQLSELDRDATLPTRECSHCGGLPPEGLRVRRATISGSLADRLGWLTVGAFRLALHSDSDFMLELNVSNASYFLNNLNIFCLNCFHGIRKSHFKINIIASKSLGTN